MTKNWTATPSKGNVERNVEIIVHVCVWIYIFASPLLTRRRDESIEWLSYFQRLYFPLTSCLVFYVNYFYLIPRLVLKSKKYKSYVLYNILLICALLMSWELYNALLPPIMEAPASKVATEVTNAVRRVTAPPPPQPPVYVRLMFVLRNFGSLAFLSFLALAVRLSVQWRKAEVARQEAELKRSEAELSNLKNQINPHFLLNTLNNIYSLTAFDTEQAQHAIQELSKLLRYILYENQEKFVDLKKETEFLVTYVHLMRIRLSSNVKVELDFDVPDDKPYQVAPLIFISLVENAFKHGVSPTQPSFIRVSLKIEDEHLRFACHNSNFPKSVGDKSPGGIGLQQVRSRLELIYPGKYDWRYGVDQTSGTYFSEIDIALS